MKPETPLRAIKAFCMACCGVERCCSLDPVRECQDEACPLHTYRMGTNPKRAGCASSDHTRPVMSSEEHNATHAFM